MNKTEWTLFEIAKLLHQPQHRLIYLCEKGVIVPELSDAQGRGSSRRLSASNIFEFAIALFIGEGTASRTLNEVPLESEKIVDALQAEIDGPRQTRDKICQAPSIE